MSALPYRIECEESPLGPDQTTATLVGDNVQFNGISYRCVLVSECQYSKAVTSVYVRADGVDPEDQDDAGDADVLFTEQPY